jgi:hypothetical protein
LLLDGILVTRGRLNGVLGTFEFPPAVVVVVSIGSPPVVNGVLRYCFQNSFISFESMSFPGVNPVPNDDTPAISKPARLLLVVAPFPPPGVQPPRKFMDALTLALGVPRPR